MSLTYLQARAEMFVLFKTAWDTTGYPAHYDDVRISRSPDDSPWAVISVQHASGFQSAIGQLFTRLGFLTVQIFTQSGKGLQEAYELCKIVSDAFEGTSTPGGVWFSNVRLNEIGRDGTFQQMNVIIDFNYYA
jgi:hypothetical protein